MKHAPLMAMLCVALLSCDDPASAPVAVAPAVAETPEPIAPEAAPGAPLRPAPPSRASTPPDVPQQPDPAPPPKADPQSAAGVWLALDSTRDMCSGRLFEWWHDYWPKGGLVSMACHMASVPAVVDEVDKVGVQMAIFHALAKASPVPVYAKKKRKPQWGKEKNHGSFGRYNPAFVEWFVANAVPGATDAALRKVTQGSYDKYFKMQARVFDETYRRIAERPCYAKEKKAYMRSVRKKRAHNRERWTDWHADNFCKGVTWKSATYSGDRKSLGPNLTRDALGFWMRRDDDGTAKIWYQGLTKLRATYEPGYQPLKTPKTPPTKAP